ncbi:MAG TPA: hypothetical protein VJ695_11745 [Nitrososphaera sp.]|nr:hypothetical protein [Nitrososphaera sp.]
MAYDDYSCHGLIIHTFESKITKLKGREAYETCRIMPSCQPDIYRRNFSAWCEECNAVFGNSFLAKQHRDTKKHKIKVSEYLVSEPAYFSYITSVLESDLEP